MNKCIHSWAQNSEKGLLYSEDMVWNFLECLTVCALCGWTGTMQVFQSLSELSMPLTQKTQSRVLPSIYTVSGPVKRLPLKELSCFWHGERTFVLVINGIFSFESLDIFLAEALRCWASFEFQRKGYSLISASNYSPQNLGLGFCLLWSLALLKEQRGWEIDWKTAYAVMQWPHTVTRLQNKKLLKV